MKVRSPAFACAALLLALSFPAWASGVPSLELIASSTNLVVTESTTVSVVLRLPPLEKPHEEIPPFHNQRPPHLTVPFLELDVKNDVFRYPLELERRLMRGVRVGPQDLLSGQSGRGNANTPVFALNEYMTEGVMPAFRDPFGMFDDDPFFGRLGSRPQLFPFQTKREEDGSWTFTLTTVPWRAASVGRKTLDAVTAKVSLIAGTRIVRDRMGRSVPQLSLTNAVYRTRPLVLSVSEPPTAGRPENYCGAISSNLAVKATLDTNICTAGDPVVLTLDVSGAADPTAVHLPDFAADLTNGVFRVDASSAKTETLADSRRFTWRVRALKAGTVEFPSLSFSYYDLGRRAYVETKTESIPIQVKAGVQAALGALDETGEETDAFPLPDGIDFDPHVGAASPLLPHLVLALALFLASPTLFLVIRLTPPVRRRVAARSEMLRKANAFKKCRRALHGKDDAKRRAAIRAFFDVRYGVNGAAVTAADAARLMAADYAEEEVALIVRTLSELDAKSYSSTTGTSAARTAGTVVTALALFLGSFAQAAVPSRVDFTCQRAGMLAMRAADEPGFKKAAAAYLAAIDEGADNPVVYSNLGACLLMAGDASGARAAYACAERRGGETPTTQRGVRAAMARLRNDPRADLPLTRVFLKPHVKYPLDVRLVFVVAVWALLWLVALLPVGMLRRFLLTVCLIAFCASVLSVSVSLAGEHLAKEALHAQK